MSDGFWKAALPIINVTERHPFLVAMVDGTLPQPNFMYYVIQDSLYLKHFGDALRILSNSKESSEEDAELLKELAIKIEEAEMCLHNSFFKKWQIDQTGVEEMPNTLLYTSYMLRVVCTRDYSEGLAVLLPCFWVYMHVGHCMLKLREELGASVQRSPQYDEWIDMYSGDEYQADVRNYIAIVDSVAALASKEKLTLMKEHFLMSCKLEHMFWDQALCLMQWPVICDENSIVEQVSQNSSF